MVEKIIKLVDTFLRKVHLKPDTVAGKCRLQFGLAIILILALALFIPYYWMGKLVDKSSLDTGSTIAELLNRGDIVSNDRLSPQTLERFIPNEEISSIRSGNGSPLRWIDLREDQGKGLAGLSQKQLGVLEMLRGDDAPSGYAWLEKEGIVPYRYYMQLVRAEDVGLLSHDTQSGAVSFNPNQEIGLIILKTIDTRSRSTYLMNTVCVIFAGLLAGSGAIIAVYVIVQRIILRPIRQLRALVNNIAEGNMDSRAAIKTDDEYQKLSDAFNSMLDGLQESQEKTRKANTQLDDKIVELSERNIELFKANKLKSEFLANMSHEFRTPLNAIIGFAEIMYEKPAEDAEKAKRYASHIVTSGRNLLNMINDLLDLAKAEAGKMKLHIDKTSVPELCKSLVAFISPMTEKKMVKVRLDVQGDIPIIYTDAGKVQQILYNFLSNAIKFTPEKGKIIIGVSLFEEKYIRIGITDNGCGIPEEQQEHIFEKFRQIDGSITREGAGTGLGLAICKELSSLLAANISVESEVGKGSTFYLDLPVLEQQQVENLKKTSENVD